MNDFCLPDDYVENPEPEYYEDVHASAGLGVSQPDVYRRVAELAGAYKPTAVVDVGCGRAEKLAEIALGEFWPSVPWFVGIDHGLNIAWCRDHHTWGRWVDHDLEAGLPKSKGWGDGVLVVMADVIEHLRDPRPLLRDVLALDPVTVVISTPDRILTRGTDDHGPPDNPAHVREWASAELVTFLTECGFDVARLTFTRSDDRDNERNTILVECHAR